MFSPYNLSRAGEAIISIAVATEERCYDSFVEFIELEGEIHQKIIIVPNMPLHDFRWIEIGLGGTRGLYFYNIDIYEAGEITPERPFLVTWQSRGWAFPHRGISFVDGYGVTRFFSLFQNEASFEENPGGRFMLNEFLPRVPFRELRGLCS